MKDVDIQETENGVSIRGPRSQIAETLLHLDGQPFSLKDYPMFRSIYESPHRQFLLKAGRQVSKTLCYKSRISRSNGQSVPIQQIAVGDEVISCDDRTMQLVPGTVVDTIVSGRKQVLRVTTRLGHVLYPATTHPLKTLEGYVPAGDLGVGARIAAVRHGGVFTGTADVTPDEAKLLGYYIGDGNVGKDIGFTNEKLPLLWEFTDICLRQGDLVRAYPKTGCNTYSLRCRRNGPSQDLLNRHQLYGKTAIDKFVPAAIFDADKYTTALFLNRLWSCDGMVRKSTPSKYDVTYCSISERLARDVQQLLWKFGIPSSIHTHVPTSYVGTEKRAYVVRIETQAAIRTFLTDIGAFCKSEHVDPPSTTSNNNRDTVPKAVEKIVQALYLKCKALGSKKTLHAAGLRNTLKYSPTRDKLLRYVEFFRQEEGLTGDELLRELVCLSSDSDIIWDEIVSIEDEGLQECYDLEVETHHNFVADGVVTHNSTSAGNFIVTEAVGMPHFRTLYIAPTKSQTEVFSTSRVGKVMHYSPFISKHFVKHSVQDNVLRKILRNGAELTFLYCSDDADRVRGISSDRVWFDEIQDILYDVVPVVLETLSASKYGYVSYSGTPKTMENTMEHIWGTTNQCEWAVKCDGCNKYNIPGMKNLGLRGFACAKCGKEPLDVRDGLWVAMNANDDKVRVAGYCLPQIIMPMNVEGVDVEGIPKWDRILYKYENYPQSKFKNEVMGQSDSVGARLITRENLQALCASKRTLYRIPDPKDRDHLKNVIATFGGADWSGGGQEGYSRTVIWIYGVLPGMRYVCLYYKIFPVGQPLASIKEIIETFKAYKVAMIAGDAGEGNLPNDHLRKAFPGIVHQIQYGSYEKPIEYKHHNEIAKYHLDRTTAIDNYLMLLIRKNAIYANELEMTPAINDILNVYEELTHTGKKVWRHSPAKPDDALHAQIMSWIAAKIHFGDLTFYK